MSKGEKKMELKFFICRQCKNLVDMVYHSGAPLICCGEEMKQLDSKLMDGAKEKHVPVAVVKDNVVEVVVSSEIHPMTAAHHIAWVYLETDQGVYRKYLEVDAEPKVKYALLEGEKPLAVYAYCNLHGLWKTNI